MTRLIAWQPLLTDHQRHTLDALGRHLGDGTVYIVGRVDDAERDRQGWSQVNVARTVLPRRGWVGWALHRLRADREAIHVFGSPFEDPRLIAILIMALMVRVRVWLVSEPWSDSDDGYFSAVPTLRDVVKARLRPLLYRAYGVMLRGRVEGVFAISPLAVRQYRAIGIDPARVFPFGYFVPGIAPLTAPADAPVLSCAFVGALIARKGVDDLAAAIRLLATRGVAINADIFGAGDPAVVPAPLHFRGRIAFGETSRVLADYDLLVVPSHHDGWAVVVNEALQAGTPVVASDRTGAGAMIDRWGCGARFRASNPGDLAEVLEGIAHDPARLAAMRAAAVALAPSLTPEVAADYMARAIGGRPVANPWYSE